MQRRSLLRLLVLTTVLLTFGTAMLARQPGSSSAAPANNKILVGYMPYWTVGGGKQTRAGAAALDGNKFTHLYFAFFEVKQGRGCQEYYADTGWDDPNNSIPNDGAGGSNTAEVIAGLKDNKAENPNLKIIGVIGGYQNSDGSGNFTRAVQTASDRQAVVDSCYNKIIGQYGLDGIDVNWEHPAQWHDPNMTDLLMRFRNKLGSGKLLTVPLAATDHNGSKYPVMESSAYVDFWLIMALDFYGAWSPRNVYYTSPLYCPSPDGSESCSLTTTAGNKNAASVDYWSGRGIPRNKLVLSAAFYGLKYTGVSLPNQTSSHVWAPYSGSVSTITYRELRTNACNNAPCISSSINLNNSTSAINTHGSSVLGSGATGYVTGYDAAHGNAYIYNQSTGVWIGFENRHSVIERAKKALELGLGGMWIWELSQDTNFELSNALCDPLALNCSGAPAAPSPTRTATAAGAPTATRTRTPTAAGAPTATRTHTPVSGVPAWAPGVAYATGARVSYGGLTYQCLQGHASQGGWEPPNAPALWNKV